MYRPGDTLIRPDDTLIRPDDTLIRPYDILIRPEDTLIRPDNILIRPDELVYCQNESFIVRTIYCIISSGRYIFFFFTWHLQAAVHITCISDKESYVCHVFSL